MSDDLLNELRSETTPESFRQPAMSQPSASHEEEHFVNLYYSHFHPTHPILVPRSRYNTQAYPKLLALVVQFIGSQYAPTFASDTRRDAADAALADNQDRSVFVVQSLLLYAIALHARAERGKAVTTLAKASDLAIQLGLNHDEFASRHGGQDALLEESFRRTWWELFVCDGYFAAIHRQTGFRCNTVELTASLPCDESMYFDGMRRPLPVTLEQLDGRFFMDQEPQFSSACYRIEAIRVLARVIAVARAGENRPDNVQAVDNAIAAWRFHLPNAKAGIIDRFGEVDQMIFQAHAFIHSASILLHFPRSELSLTLPSATDIACAEHLTQASPTSAQHAIKAISASKEMSDLAALPVDKHSPLFVCGLVFGCIVQLSACSAHSHNCLPQHRDRIALITGVLKCMGRNWAISRDVLRHLNRISNELFNPRLGLGSVESQLSLDSGIDMEAMSGNISWLDLFYVNNPEAMDDSMWDTQMSSSFRQSCTPANG